MLDYDFLKLSPLEFENLSRDLLEEYFKEEGYEFETFGTGRDGGIDFRYCTNLIKDSSDYTTVVLQCKRYSSFNSLFTALKHEFKKVANINPTRYLLSVSIDLTPFQKKKILDIADFPFAHFAAGNIFTRGDLLKILSKCHWVERKYYKLWITGTNILNQILHAKIYNYSEHELTQIIKVADIYVENSSYYEGINILEETRTLLITGMPGVGKTTLARIIILNYIRLGYDFIFVSKDIDEAYSLYLPSRKQIFYFDDFLGSNFHNNLLTKNEDKRLVDFINLVVRDATKRVVFTSREYIFNQARFYYEALRNFAEESKFRLDLDRYGSELRATILYNHLYFSGLPKEHIDNLLQDKRYLAIIRHKNYSPRLIELFTKESFYSRFNASEYFDKISETLQNPFFIWEIPYHQEITEESRSLLSLLAISNDSCDTECLYRIYEFYRRHADNIEKSGRHHFNKCLEEILGTFVLPRNDKFLFCNPAIKDFLYYNLSQNRSSINSLIQNSFYLDHLLHAFFPFGHDFVIGGIMLDKQQSQLLECRIYEDFSNFEVLQTDKKIGNVILQKLDWICRRFVVETYARIKELVIREVQKISVYILNNEEKKIYFTLLGKVKANLTIDFTKMLHQLAPLIANINDLVTFTYLKDVAKKEFEKFVKDEDDFYWSIYELVKITDSKISYDKIYSDIERIESAFGIGFPILKSRLYEWYYPNPSYNSRSDYYDYRYESDDDELTNMFNTLYSKFD